MNISTFYFCHTLKKSEITKLIKKTEMMTSYRMKKTTHLLSLHKQFSPKTLMLKKRFPFVNYQHTAYQKAKHLNIFPFSTSAVSIIPSCSMFPLVFVHSRGLEKDTLV